MESTTTSTTTPTSSTSNFDNPFLGCSPLNSHPYSWNPIFCTSSNNNKLYDGNGNGNNEFGESRPEETTLGMVDDNDAGYLPKIEEDMLGSFSNFSTLLNSSNPSMENESTWFNGFPQYYTNSPSHSPSPSPSRGLIQDHLLNHLGLASTPRLGLNLQPMDFFGTNSFHAFGVGDQLLTPPMSNKSTSAALRNGITGTKRAAGSYRSDEPKVSTSTNSATPTKKSQLRVSCPPFKVRKEKLGDRIAALHQLVSPFGKTDTASVLTEAIGYIQFLQDQIHTLCMPHAKTPRNRHAGTREDEEERAVELGRRGLTLVPLSWTSFITPTQLDASNQSFF